MDKLRELTEKIMNLDETPEEARSTTLIALLLAYKEIQEERKAKDE
jgi:hypothetical protein